MVYIVFLINIAVRLDNWVKIYKTAKKNCLLRYMYHFLRKKLKHLHIIYLPHVKVLTISIICGKALIIYCLPCARLETRELIGHFKRVIIISWKTTVIQFHGYKIVQTRLHDGERFSFMK